MVLKEKIKCVLHGSFRRNFDLVKEMHTLFTNAGIDVVAPDISKIVDEKDGFVYLQQDQSKDYRMTELLYLKTAAELGSGGFSYYLNPHGRLGTSTSYELAVDQLTNTRYFFMMPLRDHPAYIPHNSIWKPEKLVEYVQQ